ncbi:proliferation marker protein Ki-67 isoform X2 [Dendrobates tinctorius]
MPLHGEIIVIKRNGTDGTHFPLTATSCLFGRKAECDIRIQLPHVSKEHCKVEVRDNGEVFVTNLSSVNPTQLNGTTVIKPICLKHGDVLTIIDRSFRFEKPPTQQGKRRSAGLDSETFKVFASNHPSDTNETVRIETLINKTQRKSEGNIIKTTHSRRSLQVSSSSLPRSDLSPFGELYEMLKSKVEIGKTPVKDKSSSPKNVALKRSLQMQDGSQSPVAPKRSSRSQSSDSPLTRPKEVALEPRSASAGRVREASKSPSRSPKTSTKDLNKSLQEVVKEPEATTRRRSKRDSQPASHEPVHPIVNGYEEKRSSRRSASAEESKLESQIQSTPTNEKTADSPTPRRRGTQSASKLVLKNPDSSPQGKSPTQGRRSETLEKSPKRTPSAASVSEGNASEEVEPRKTPRKRRSDELSLPEPPPKRKRVSFGGHLSPELFDKRLPPNSPLKKGATPARRSLPLNSTHTVIRKSFGLKQSVIREVFEQSAGKSPNVSRSSPTRSSPVKRSPAKQSPLAKSLSPSKSSVSVKSPAGAQTAASVTPVKNSPAKKSPVEMLSFSAKLTPVKKSPSAKSPVRSPSRSPKGLSLKSIPTTPAKTPSERSPVARMPSSLKRSPVGETPTSAVRSPVARTPSPFKKSPMVSSPAKTPTPAKRSPVAKTPTPAKRSPVAKTPTPAKRSPVAKTPTPAKRSPVAKTPTPAKRSPVAKTPTPAKRSPVAKTPTPAKRSPVAKTPTPAKRSPVAKTPTPAKRSPVAKTPTPAKRSPVAKTPTPAKRSPVAKTPTPAKRSPVAKTPTSVRRSPVAKTPTSVRRSPVAKTPTSVRRSPVAKTPTSVRRSPVAKTPTSVRRSPVAKTPTSVRRSPVAKTPTSVRRSPVAKTPTSVRRSPVAKTPTSVRRSPVAKTPTSVRRSPVAKTPTSVRRSPVAKTPTSVRRSPVAKTPSPVRRSPVAKTPSPAKLSPVAKTPTSVRRSAVAKMPTPAKLSPVAKTPTPVKRSPVAKTPTSVRRSPVAKTPTSVRRSSVTKTPSPAKLSPVAKTPTSVRRSPVAKTPTSVRRSPVAKTPTSVRRSPVAKTPTSVRRSPVAKTPTSVRRSPVAKTPTSVRRSPVAKTPTSVRRSPVAKTPTSVRRSPVAKTPTSVRRSPVAKTPTSVRRSPVAKTPTPVTPYMKGRFSVSRIGTPPQEQVQSDLPASQTPKTSRKSLSMRKTPRRSRKLEAFELIRSRRRSGATEANLLVSKTWADVVKVGVAKSQRTINKPAQKIAAIKKKLKHKTPMKKIKDVTSTGHADSPATILVGRAHTRVVNLTGFVPKVMRNQAVRLDPAHNESFTGVAELFSTPPNIKPRKSNRLETSKTESPSSVLVEVSAMQTPEESGEMVVSPLDSPKTTRRKQYSRDAVSRLLQSPASPELRNEDGSATVEITAGTSKSQKNSRKSMGLSGIKRIMRTPKQKGTPVTDPHALRKLLRTPTEPESSRAYSRRSTKLEVLGIDRLMKTPKEKPAPVEDFTGVQRIMKTPKQKAEPLQDFAGVKRITRTPKEKVQLVEDLVGVKQTMRTPKEKSLPVEDMVGIKRIMRTPKVRCQPLEDMIGIKRIMKTPKERGQPVEDIALNHLLSTPTESVQSTESTRPIEEIFGIKNLIKTPPKSSVSEEALSKDRGSRSAKSAKRGRPAKRLSLQVDTPSGHAAHDMVYVQITQESVTPTNQQVVKSTPSRGRPSTSRVISSIDVPKDFAESGEITSPKRRGRPSSAAKSPTGSASKAEKISPTQRPIPKAIAEEPKEFVPITDGKVISPARKVRPSTTVETPRESVSDAVSEVTSSRRRGRPSSKAEAPMESLAIFDLETIIPTVIEVTSPSHRGRRSSTGKAAEITSPAQRGKPKSMAEESKESVTIADGKVTSPALEGRPSTTSEAPKESVVSEATSPRRSGRPSSKSDAFKESPAVSDRELASPTQHERLGSRRGRQSSSTLFNDPSTSPATKGRQSTTTEVLEVPEVTSPSRRGRAIKTTAPGPEESAPSVETKLASPSRRGRPSSSVVTNASSLSTSPAPKGRQSATTEALEEVPEVTSPSRRGRAIKTTAPDPEESAPSVETKLASPSRRGRPSSSVVTNASSLSTSPAPKGRQSTTTEALDEVPEVTSPSRRGRAIKTTAPDPEESAPSVETKLASPSRRGRPSSSVVTNASSLSTSPAPKGRQSTTTEALDEVPEVTSPSRRGRAIKTTAPDPEESAPSVETKLASTSRRGRPSSSVVTNASSLTTSPAPKGRQSTTTEALDEVPEVTSPSRRGRAIKTTAPDPEESAPSVETKLTSTSRRGRPSSSVVTNASSLTTSPAPKGRQSSTTEALEEVPEVTSPSRRGRAIKTTAPDPEESAPSVETKLASPSRRGRPSSSVVTNASSLSTSPAPKGRHSSTTEVLEEVPEVTSPSRRGRAIKTTAPGGPEESAPSVETKLASTSRRGRPSSSVVTNASSFTTSPAPKGGRQSTTTEALEEVPEVTSPSRRGRAIKTTAPDPEESAPSVETKLASPSRRGRPSSCVVTNGSSLSTSPAPKGRQSSTTEALEEVPEVTSPSRRGRAMKTTAPDPEESAPSVETKLASPSRRGRPSSSAVNNASSLSTSPAPKGRQSSTTKALEKSIPVPAVASPVRRGRPIKSRATDKSVTTAETQLTSRARRGKQSPSAVANESVLTSPALKERLSTSTEVLKDVTAVTSPNRRGRPKKGTLLEESIPTVETKLSSLANKKKPSTLLGIFQDPATDKDHPVLVSEGKTTSQTRRGRQKEAAEEFPQESSAPALLLTRASRSEIPAEVSELSEQLPSTQSRRGRQKASAQVSEVLVSSPTRRSKSKDTSEAPKDSVPSVTEATSQKRRGRRKMPDVTKESNSVTDGKTTAPKKGTRSKATVDASGESGPAVEEVTSHTRRGRARKTDMPKEPEVTLSVQEANAKSANDVSEVASTRKGRSRKTEVSKETVAVSEVISPKRRRKPDIAEGDSSLEREQPVVLPVHTSPVTRRGGRRKNTEELAVAEPDATKPKTSKQATRGRVQPKAKGVTEVKESSDSADEPIKSPEPKSPKESAEQAKDLATESQPKSLRGRPRKSKDNSPKAGSETVVPEVKVPQKSAPARGRSRAARDISDASDDQTQESSLPSTKPQRGSRRNRSVPDRSSATHEEPTKLLSTDITESTTKSTRGKKSSNHDGPQPAPEVKGRKNVRGTTLQNVEELVISKSKAKSVQWHPLLATDIQSTADEVTAQESNEASARGGRSKGKAKPDVPEPQIPAKRSRRGNIKEAEETLAASGPERPTVLDATPRKRGKGANVQLEDTEAKSTNETINSTKVKSLQRGRRAALNVLNAENNEEHEVQLSTSRRQRGTATSKTADEKESAHSPVKDKSQKGGSGKSNDDGKSPKSTRGVKRKLPNADANIPLPEERETLSRANKSVLVETENIPAGRGRKNQRNAKTQKSEEQEVPLVKLAVTSESPAKRRKTEAATTASPKRSSRQQTSKPDIEKPSAAGKTRTSARSRK